MASTPNDYEKLLEDKEYACLCIKRRAVNLDYNLERLLVKA